MDAIALLTMVLGSMVVALVATKAALAMLFMLMDRHVSRSTVVAGTPAGNFETSRYLAA